MLHDVFLAEALGLAPTDQDRVLLRVTFDRLWKLRWENLNKDVWWRLTVDGVPILGNSHMRVAPVPCLCGTPVVGSVRRHHFWTCPAAQAVMGAVAATAGCPVTMAMLWLVRSPGEVHSLVWDVVCLAALGAMDDARICLKGCVRDQVASGVAVATATSRAVASFWGRISDFVALHAAPRGWEVVPLGNPFIGCDNGRLRLNR